MYNLLLGSVLVVLLQLVECESNVTNAPPQRSSNPTITTTAPPVLVEESFPVWGYGVLGGVGALVLLTLVVVAIRWNIDGSNLKKTNPSSSSGNKDLERKLLSRGGCRGGSLESPKAKKRPSAKRDAMKSSQVLRATSQDVMMGYCETAELKAMEFERSRGQTAPGADSHLQEWLAGCVVPQPQVGPEAVTVAKAVQVSQPTPTADAAAHPANTQFSVGGKAAALHALLSSQAATSPPALAGLHRATVFNNVGEEADLEASKLTNPLSKDGDHSTCLPTGGSRTTRTYTMAVTSGYGTSQHPSARAERRESRRSMWTAPEGGPLLSQDEEEDVVEVMRVAENEHDPLDSTLPELILTYGSAPNAGADLAAYEISPPAGATRVDDLLQSPEGGAVHIHITPEMSQPGVSRNPTAPPDIHEAGQMIQLPSVEDSLSADVSQRERRPSDFL